jgi:DNA-directed RNA polymerase
VTHSGHTDDLPGYPPPIADIERQQRYEVDAVARGVRRLTTEVQALAEDGRFDATAPGYELVGRLFRQVSDGIRDLQAFALEAENNGGRKPAWGLHAHAIDADRMALITLRTLAGVLGARELKERRVLRLSKAIGTAIQMELEFDQWRRRDRKLAKETGDLPLYDRLVRNGKKVDARYFARLRKRVETIERLGWPEEERVQLGSALIQLAVGRAVHPKHGPWFTVGVTRIRGRSEKVLALTDWGRETLQAIEEDIGINRPVFLPMLAPPKQWELQMDTEGEA